MVKRHEKKPIDEPKPIVYFVFGMLFVAYPAMLHPFSSFYWLIPWAALGIAVSAFGLNFHINFYEDYLIEDILQRAFSEERLEPQDTALDYDLDALYTVSYTHLTLPTICSV